jgi:hypothetical protein
MGIMRKTYRLFLTKPRILESNGAGLKAGTARTNLPADSNAASCQRYLQAASGQLGQLTVI